MCKIYFLFLIKYKKAGGSWSFYILKGKSNKNVCLMVDSVRTAVRMGDKMIQDIFPMKFHNEYIDKKPNYNSSIIYFQEENILMKQVEEKQIFPIFKELNCITDNYIYLFAVDDIDYFLLMGEPEISLEGYVYESIGRFRDYVPKYMGFVMVTAFHLYHWYLDNRYCGRCGKSLVQDIKERMLFCPECHNIVYPRIAPAVIVAIINGDKILMTKYASSEYKRYALVAGFAEIGETLEETVAREVMEEVGLKVKNICYYKSQPWAFSGTLLSGFFAELDGSDEIILEEEELSEGAWFHRDDIPFKDDEVSLTREMIRVFQEGK